MTKIINIKVALAFATIVLFGAAFAVAQADHNWSKYHWDKSTDDTLTDPLKLSMNLTTDAWKQSLLGASTDWNESVIKNRIVPGSKDSSCDPTLGQVEVCNGAYGPNGWLGIAQIWAYRGKDGHIAQGVVKVNDTYFSNAIYDIQAMRNLVMCQEVGHTFGLGHQDENFSNANLGTCMDYTSDPDGRLGSQLDNQHPNEHDYEMLTEIYGHLNGVSGGGGGGDKPKGGNGGGRGKPAGVGADIDVSNPSEWGQAIKQDAQGRDSLYVRNLGNGLEVITHVLWTMEHEDEEHNH